MNVGKVISHQSSCRCVDVLSLDRVNKTQYALGLSHTLAGDICLLMVRISLLNAGSKFYKFINHQLP